jgi:hypothetical protein
VNNQEAKKILALFRPGSADEEGPFFPRGPATGQNRPGTGPLVRRPLRGLSSSAPEISSHPHSAGLKEQILSERKIQRPLFQRYWRPLLAAAAVVALLASMIPASGPSTAPDRYAAYRKRMTETALAQLLHGFDGDRSRPDPQLPQGEPCASRLLPAAGLKTAAVVGCAVSSWQGSPVSMICFKSGRPLPPGDQSDLWLFVIEPQDRRRCPPPAAPSLPA